MKFILVSPFTNASGSSIRFWNIAETLAKRGHQVVFTERLAKGDYKLYWSKNVKYYGCPSCGILILDIFFSLMFYLFILLRHFNCKVYYALKPAPNNCIPAFIAALFGKKIILDIDDLDYAYLNKNLIRKIGEIYFNLLSKFFPLVTYHTPQLKRYLLEKVNLKEERLYY
ncbi:MAG: hypothetical protein N2053_10675, partial [Chitinispirillaceae bacterium]|nr:hypothetical protein [Chitinispirillaceae bacterium]